MRKEIISDTQGISIVILYIAGTALAFPTASEAGSDLWLSIITAMILAIPFLLIYSRLLSLYHGKDLFDILEIVFGKYIGKLISILFTFHAFFLGAYILFEYGEFLIFTSLPETPKYIPMIFITILLVWITKEGIETIGRWSSLFVLLNGPLPSIAILLLISKMDINNILPILYNGPKPYMRGTLSAFTFPFAQVVILLMVFSCLKTKKSSYKVFFTGFIIGGVLILGVSLAEILVLGEGIYTGSYSPNYSVAKKINVGEFLQRLEVITILATYTAGFIKVGICFLAGCIGISKVFGFKDYRFLVIPAGILLLNLGIIIHDNMMDSIKWDEEVYIYYALLFQVILPTIIIITAEVRRRAARGDDK